MKKRLKGLALLILCFSIAGAQEADLGVITGFVRFPGETPPRDMFANPVDHDCPPGIPDTHLLVKQETLGLQNVLVVLDRQDRRVMPTSLAAQLRMDGCQLLPRIQWVPLGTSVNLIDKDGATHHLHAYLGDNTVFEATLSADSPVVRRPLVVPGLYKINCDRHLWERAWIYVSPDDSVAITDAQGQFTMKNVPAGRYHIRAWHEGWTEKSKDQDGRMEFIPMQEIRTIKVRDGQESQVSFEDLSPAVAASAAD